MRLLKSIFICSGYFEVTKIIMDDMSKQCVLENLNLGHWFQVLGLVLILDLKSWIRDLDLSCQVLHLGSWILQILGLRCCYHKVGHELLLSVTGITKCNRCYRSVTENYDKLWQVLQSETGNYYNMRQVLQSVTIIGKSVLMALQKVLIYWMQ